MKRTTALASLLAALSVFLSVPGCRHFPRPVAEWADCVGRETEWRPLISDVAKAFGEKNYQDALMTLAMRVGWPAIDCAVEAFLTQTEGTLATGRGAPQDHLRAGRARQWLAERSQGK